jgi:hypothetical protein
MKRVTIRGILAALLMGAAAIAPAKPAPAKEPPPNPNDACLACHGDATAKSEAGKSIAVDAARFGGSVHGAMQLPCAGCHADVSADKFPHGKVKAVDCATCHEKAVKEYANSIHGKAHAEGRNVAATCTDCHGSHDIKRSADVASRTNHANIEATCAACHGNDATIKKGNIPGGNVAGKYHDSIHGVIVGKKGTNSGAAPTCTNCHGAHDMRPKSDPESRVSRKNIPDTCGGCHMGVKEVWKNSQHGKLRQNLVLVAPGCSDCHSAHAIQAHDKPQWQVDVIKECGNCHGAYLSTYRDTFHGQVTDLGFVRVATCASCHGAHEMLPKDNPLSKVSSTNRLKTCQACHPKANANFVLYEPHANKHKKEGGVVLYYTALFMQLLLAGVFAFFGLHTILWLYRSLHVVAERRAARRAAQQDGEKN